MEAFEAVEAGDLGLGSGLGSSDLGLDVRGTSNTLLVEIRSAEGTNGGFGNSCVMFMMALRNVLNKAPCRGLLMKSVIIFAAGQWRTLTRPRSM